jgi:glyoxylase I family protein
VIQVREIDHLVLRVVDLGAMLAFYRDVLGCALLRAREDIGLYQLRCGSSMLDLVPVGSKAGGEGIPAQATRNLDHFCLRVEPFDEATIRAHLAAHGLEAGPVQMRFGAEGYGPSMYLEDPEGNTVELKGPPTATPA